MINGAHVVVTSTNPEADHALLRDVFKLPHVSDGGSIIFGHGASNNAHPLFLTCDDIRAFRVMEMTLVYQSRHARPKH